MRTATQAGSRRHKAAVRVPVIMNFRVFKTLKVLDSWGRVTFGFWRSTGAPGVVRWREGGR